MIKCPKCGFSQPADIYCASCGIKMDSYAKKHRASGLASNWMVHVCLLVIVIIGFVLYDKISSRKSRIQAISAQALPSTTDSNTISRSKPNTYTAESSQKSKAAIADTQTADNSSLETANAAGHALESPAAVTVAPGTRANKLSKGIQVSFYRITPQGVGELQKISQALNIAGESSGGLVPQSRIQQLIKSGDLQYIAGNLYKDFDEKHPTMVFKGQRHSEAARNMGLFFQITSLRKNEGSHLIEVRGWGALKATEPDENYFTSELTLSPKTTAFITGFLPKKSTYTEDEKQLFEGDRVLKTLNQEDFIDGSTDLIMFIEFSKSN